MSHGLSETIVAPITGVGKAAVAVIRVSGPETWRVAREVFCPLPETPVARYAYYGEFKHGDDGLCLLFADGASFTGEASAEFSVHGSPASVKALLDCCVQAGCRLAGPGEFTLRAFMNGRLDLAQAEAVREVVEAQTIHQFESAHRDLETGLTSLLEPVEAEVLYLLAAVEASVDFEEEIGPLDRAMARERVLKCLVSLNQILDKGAVGEMMRQGMRVALIGRPNVGKSSLLNALAGANRAIVTDIPGTTRDVLEVALDLRGYPVILMDTAGQREAEDLVESAGIERAKRAAEAAHLVVLVYDCSAGWTAEDERLLANVRSRKHLVLGNKSDISLPSHGLGVSAKTGHGLGTWIALLVNEFDSLDGQILPNPRQAVELGMAQDRLTEVAEQLATDAPDDLLSVGLTATLTHIGRVTGKTADHDMLDRIFSEFCIGK